MRLEEKRKKHVKNIIEGIKFQTHIIGRQPFKIGPNCDRVPKAHVHILNDKTILNGPSLKRKGRHEYNAQVNIVCKNIVYKMNIVCKTRKYENSLQEHKLQFFFSKYKSHTRKRKEINLQKLLRPHQLAQGPLTECIQVRVQIGKICLLPVSSSSIPEVTEEG